MLRKSCGRWEMLIQCSWSLVLVLIWLPRMKTQADPLAVGDGYSPEMQLGALRGSFWMPSLQGWVPLPLPL